MSIPPMSDGQLERLREALTERYALTRRIGAGGMATVYLAEDLRHRRSVAIKVLHPELAATLGPERFLREISIAAQLSHPNILPMFEAGRIGGSEAGWSGDADAPSPAEPPDRRTAQFLYYTMPFVEGESLRDRLAREGELPVRDVVRVMHQVADALAHAHARGVVHRDIKPDNLLLTGRQTQVMDFGVAKAVSEAVDHSGLTSAGMAVGTPAYMAPEQAAADPNVDHRADLYALGVVAYEMLSGRVPFERDTPQQMLAAHIAELPPPLGEVRTTVPSSLAAVVMKCLAKLPADRWQSADDLARALEELDVSGAEPAVALRGFRTRTALLMSGTLVAVAAIVGVTFGRDESGPAASGPDPARVAVLYFDDHSPDGNLGYLADGLTEALIQELGRIPALDVISRNGVRVFREGRATLDSIQRMLAVGTLVEGSVARSEDRVRVSVQLTDAVTGSELESRTLERPWQELFALQDDLAREVSYFLRARLGETILLRERRAGTGNLEAWELVRRAERSLEEADRLVGLGDTASADRVLAGADSMLVRAGALDDDWIEPVVLRGWIAAERADLPGGTPYEYTTELNRRGIELADAALARRPGAGEAFELKGVLEWRMSQDQEVDDREGYLEAAERDLRAAVAVDPTRARAWAALSALLRWDTRFREAKDAAERAYEADQFLEEVPVVLFRLYQTSLELKELEEANRWCAEGQRRFPTRETFAACGLFMLALEGGPVPSGPMAWESFHRLVEASSPTSRTTNEPAGLSWVAAALARAGERDSARAVLGRAREQATPGLRPWIDYYGANVAVLSGSPDDALSMLARFLEANPDRKHYLASDWMFEPLWEDARFQALVDTTRAP